MHLPAHPGRQPNTQLHLVAVTGSAHSIPTLVSVLSFEYCGLCVVIRSAPATRQVRRARHMDHDHTNDWFISSTAALIQEILSDWRGTTVVSRGLIVLPDRVGSRQSGETPASRQLGLAVPWRGAPACPAPSSASPPRSCTSPVSSYSPVLSSSSSAARSS